MVDSNKQRENLLPSEKAFAYKMKFDAIKQQGKRNDLGLALLNHRYHSDSKHA
jgi:ParB family chromosome partitioning protein